jgi:OOP family OmpA-OmpF porin
MRSITVSIRNFFVQHQGLHFFSGDFKWWVKPAAGFFMSGVVALAVQAQQTPSPQGAAVEGKLGNLSGRIEILGRVFNMPLRVGEDQARVVFYRTQQDALPGATSVFVNGEYHASIVRGGYSELCISPGPAEFGSRQMQAGARPKDPYDTISAMQVPGGRTQYLKVHVVGGRPVLRNMSEEQALRELDELRLQMHTISRVDAAQACREVIKPEMYEVELGADALFAFDRSSLDALLPEGRMSLDRLIEQLREQNIQVQRMHAIGHADPLGTAAHNERLAQDRAQTVIQYLQSNGLDRALMSSEGLGARQPVVDSCGRRPTPEAIRCNQPNRRVVLRITGISPKRR